jgi:hypothetical protein
LYSSSRFFLLAQHFHAGVNEWLMIRNSQWEILKWLLICRDEFRGGSEESQGSQPRPAAVRRASGNIGAIGLLRPLWFFRRMGAAQKKMLEVPGGGEGFYPLRPAVHLEASALYSSKDKFTCNLNDMRS